MLKFVDLFFLCLFNLNGLVLLNFLMLFFVVLFLKFFGDINIYGWGIVNLVNVGWYVFFKFNLIVYLFLILILLINVEIFN